MPTSAEIISIDRVQRPLFAGVDVGGTNTKIGVVDDLGRTVAYTQVATLEERGPRDAIERIVAALSAVCGEKGLQLADMAAVGLGTPGTMDIPAGMILEPPNMPGWRNFPVRDCLSQTCGRPVSYANDAGAATYGEFWVGSGKAFHSIVLLTLGTGVGGGIIVGDLSIDGENSHGAECGHIIIDSRDDARVCSCGQRGHLEAYASATALVKRAEETLSSAQPSSLHDWRRKNPGDPLTPLVLAGLAEEGDEASLNLILDTAFYLGIAAVSLAHTIDPGALILGGAMNFGGHQTALGRRFLDRVRDTVLQRTFPVIAKKITIDFASLGGDAGYIGAAGIARAQYKKQQ